MTGLLLALSVPTLLLAATRLRRGSKNDDMTLGDLIEVGANIEGAHLWLDARGRPSKQGGKLAIKVVREDLLVPSYLYYYLEYLADRGLWAGRKVTAEALRALPVSFRRS